MLVLDDNANGVSIQNIEFSRQQPLLYNETISICSGKLCGRVLYRLNSTLLLPFTLIYMLFHNIMRFIALMVPQGTTQILLAVKDTKTTDA